MAKAMKSNEREGIKCVIPPLRNMNNFIRYRDRYRTPLNMTEWRSRMLNNILFYQTNYVTLWIWMFLWNG